MAEGEPFGLQPLLEVGAEDPGLDGCRQGLLVDVDDLAEAGETDAHAAVEVRPEGVDASDDARSTAERDDGDALVGADSQQLVDLGVRSGV